MAVTQVTRENVATIRFHSRIIAFTKDDHVFVLAIGQKNTAMFMPIAHGFDYKYKGKNAQASVQAALQNGEVVHACDSYSEFMRFFART